MIKPYRLINNVYVAIGFVVAFSASLASAAEPFASITSPEASITVELGETVTFEVTITHEDEVFGADWYSDSPQADFLSRFNSSSVIVVNSRDPETDKVLSATMSQTYQMNTLGGHQISAQPIAREFIDGQQELVYNDTVAWNVNVIDPSRIDKPRYMHVGDAHIIIGDPILEQHLLAFSHEYDISGYILYNVNQLLPDGEQPQAQALNDFIVRAKAEHGIQEVGFAVDVTRQVEAIVSFVESYTAHIDFLQTEYEFWNINNDLTFAGYIALLDSMDLQISSNNLDIAVTTYLGHLTDGQEAEQVADILDRVERVFLSCYVHDIEEDDENAEDADAILAANNADYLYNRCQERLSWFGQNGSNVEVWPIISAEYREHCYCTGPWLQQYGMSAAENLFEQDFSLDVEADSWRSNVNLKGYVYFEFKFLSQFVIPEPSVMPEVVVEPLAVSIGTGETVVLDFNLMSDTVDAQIFELGIRINGDIDELVESIDVDAVYLYLDANNDGVADIEERLVTNNTDHGDGNMTFVLSDAYLMSIGATHFLVTYAL